MTKESILHIQDSPYCFPVDKNKMVLRIRAGKGEIKEAFCYYESKYVIGQKQKKERMYKAFEGELFDWFEIRLTLEDTRLAYVFYLDDGKEGFFFSEDGCTKTYDFEMGYYNFFQYPYINEADIVRPVKWMENAVFYQIFPDRFNRGIMDKDDSYINMKWGDKPFPKSFAGGDIPGIINKLDYLKNLGINAVYLTPVFESISNHKYDIGDYYKVDKQFGTNEDLKRLVDCAHEKGIKIVLDAVFNHSSDRLEQFEDVLEHGKESPYFDWFIINGNRINSLRTNYETFAHCKYMPKLNTSNPKVQRFLIDIALYYIKEYNIDGWRLDVSDEISQEFWRKFRSEVKAANAEAVIIGENWHDAYRNLRGDQYDGIMNYSFTKLCLDFFKTGEKNTVQAAWKINELLMRNKEGINRQMLNLLDSHDTHRFFTEIGTDRAVFKEALALLFFFQGAPCIFYGTEILTEGGYDPDCRKCMDWNKTETEEFKDIYDLINRLSSFRKKEKINEGRFFARSENGILIVTSEGLEDTFNLYINHGSRAKCIDGIKIPAEDFKITKNGRVSI